MLSMGGTKIDLRTYLYHAIRPYTIKCNEEEAITDEIKILKSIIKAKAFLSRNNLKGILTEEEWNNLVNGHKVNWNQSDWISLAASHNTTIDNDCIFPGEWGGGIPVFYEHIKEFPSIILDLRY